MLESDFKQPGPGRWTDQSSQKRERCWQPTLSFKQGEGNQLLHPFPMLLEGSKPTGVSQPGEALSLCLSLSCPCPCPCWEGQSRGDEGTGEGYCSHLHDQLSDCELGRLHYDSSKTPAIVLEGLQEKASPALAATRGYLYLFLVPPWLAVGSTCRGKGARFTRPTKSFPGRTQIKQMAWDARRSKEIVDILTLGLKTWSQQ